MAPLNVIISSSNASATHSSNPSSNNHLSHATRTPIDRDDRRGRTIGRRVTKRFLVYPVDQHQLHLLVNNDNTNQRTMKWEKMRKNNWTEEDDDDGVGLKMMDNKKGGAEWEQGMMGRNGTCKNSRSKIGWEMNGSPVGQKQQSEVGKIDGTRAGMVEMNGGTRTGMVKMNGTEAGIVEMNGGTRTGMVEMNGTEAGIVEMNGGTRTGMVEMNGTEAGMVEMNGGTRMGMVEMNGTEAGIVEMNGTEEGMVEMDRTRMNLVVELRMDTDDEEKKDGQEQKNLGSSSSGIAQLDELSLDNEQLTMRHEMDEVISMTTMGTEEEDNSRGRRRRSSTDGRRTDSEEDSVGDEGSHGQGELLPRHQHHPIAVTDGLWTDDDAFGGSDGQCSSSPYVQMDEPLQLSDEEEPGQHQQQHNQLKTEQDRHQPMVASYPHVVHPFHSPSTPAKFYEHVEEMSSDQQQMRQCRIRRVQVPTVAQPCGWTSPERQGIRRSKVIMLGDSGVGKTSIVFSYKYGPNPGLLMSSCNATIGASYTNFDISVFNNVRVQLQLWDTAGQERFRCMVPMYMRNASAAILVYDITNRESFHQVAQWHNEVMRCPNTDDEPIVVLVGNKADQQNENRDVAEGEGEEMALRLNAHFFEVSAVDTEVIRSIFRLVAEKIVLKSANVESANEADEALFADGGEPTDDDRAAQRGESSPVIRLGGSETGDCWTTPLECCRSWWRNVVEQKLCERPAASCQRTHSAKCCSVL